MSSSVKQYTVTLYYADSHEEVCQHVGTLPKAYEMLLWELDQSALQSKRAVGDVGKQRKAEIARATRVARAFRDNKNKELTVIAAGIRYELEAQK